MEGIDKGKEEVKEKDKGEEKRGKGRRRNGRKRFSLFDVSYLVRFTVTGKVAL